MLNSELKVYFDLEPSGAMESFDQRNALQIETYEEMDVTQLGNILKRFADVQVVKQSKTLWWVLFDEFTKGHSLDTVIEDKLIKTLGVVRRAS